MANKNIKKEAKKKKKTDSSILNSFKPMMSEPELVRKPRKGISQCACFTNINHGSIRIDKSTCEFITQEAAIT